MNEQHPEEARPISQQPKQTSHLLNVEYEPDPGDQQEGKEESVRTRLVLKIQKNIRANLTRVKLKEEFKKIHKRKKILKELIDTEEGYIRDLGFIVSDFKMRMISRGVLTKEESNGLFANVDEIRKLHDIFFSTLYNHFANYHPYLIIFADVLNNILFFRIYIEYLNNFPLACDLIDQFKKTKPAFAGFVAEIGRAPLYRFLSLEDYMIKPVQRLPKYVLLLKELLKNTHHSHPDYKNVKKALEQFQEVNNNNNQKLNRIRNSYKLRELESMLQLPEDVITPSTDFILEETVQIMSQQTNEVISNCVLYLLSNNIIVARRYGTALSRQTHQPSRSSHSARISQAGFGTSMMKEKLQTIVPIKYGTWVKLNKDQCFYKNSFTVQSAEGQSCTFICSSQEELHNLYSKINKQRETVNEQTLAKYKSMFQTDSIDHNSTFIKAISILDLVPEVTVLGTSERTDKMLKYTVYIVEVKIKMIRQKIFLRFSELLELERFITNEYRNKIVIKQGLVNSSWLNNHHQKTIEERKMNIQRFLKEILSKPQVIENGWKILIRLGLPGDFYELPSKIAESKGTESFMKKSSVLGKSNLRKKNFKSNKVSTRFRLSLFQQQKIEEMEEEDLSENEEEIRFLVKQSFEQDEHMNPKSSYGSTFGQKTLCIQDILKANEINLGHYTRQESVDFNENNFSRMDKFQTMLVNLQILVPCLESLYSMHKHPNNQKGENRLEGFRAITIKCTKVQRVQNIIPMVAKQISLRYYKDYRLLIEKEYSQRVLDDDELVHKIMGEISRTKSTIIFRKIIYIDHEIEEKELARDKERLEILAAQIINQIKLGKYRLNYENYLKFSVLSAIVYKESLMIKKNVTSEMLQNFAKEAKACIFPKYSSLSQTEDIWVADFIRAYNIIEAKLKEVAWLNHEQVEKQKLSSAVEFHEEQHDLSNGSFYSNTSIKYLALLSIVKEIEKKEHFYGCVEFPVQISEEFKKFLQLQVNADIENLQSQSERSSADVEAPTGSQTVSSVKSGRKLSDEENKNCWLGIKHNKIIFTSITKGNILFELEYEKIRKIEPYASAVVLEVKDMQVNRIKLKTTSSYYIRQMLVYYRNYRTILKKICLDSDLRDSIIGISREELSATHQEMDECYL